MSCVVAGLRYYFRIYKYEYLGELMTSELHTYKVLAFLHYLPQKAVSKDATSKGIGSVVKGSNRRRSGLIMSSPHARSWISRQSHQSNSFRCPTKI